MVGRELLTLQCPTGEDHQGVSKVWGETAMGATTTNTPTRSLTRMTKGTAFH